MDVKKIDWPRTVKSYHFRHVIGKGGFGAVYQATCTLRDGRKVEVAVKIMKKKLLEDAKLVDRVLREIEIQWQMKHSSIATLFTYFEDAKYVFLVTELCKNGDLFRYIKTRKRALSEPEARGVLLQLMDALDYLHSRDVVHRDLKLSNVLLHDDMTIRLCDFGLASKLPDSSIEQSTKVICGTPNYLPPEMLRGRFGVPSDIWGIGCMLITMLTGTPPFQGTGSVESTFENVRRGKYTIDKKLQLSTEARDLIETLLRPDPAKRPTLAQIRVSRFFNPLLPVDPLRSTEAAPLKASCKTVPLTSALPDDRPNSAMSGAKSLASHKPSSVVTVGTSGDKSTYLGSDHTVRGELLPVYLKPLKPFVLRRKHCVLRMCEAKPIMFAFFFGDSELLALSCSSDQVFTVPWSSEAANLETCAERDILDMLRNALKSASNRHSLGALPRRWTSRYLYSYNIVNLLASKVPEIVLQTRECKSMLMSNRPDADFHMVFRDGVKVHAFINKKKVEIKMPDSGGDVKVYSIDLKRPDLSSIYLPDAAVKVFLVFQKQLVLCLQGLEKFGKLKPPREPLKITISAKTGDLICTSAQPPQTQYSASSSSSSLATLVSSHPNAPIVPSKLSSQTSELVSSRLEKYVLPTKWTCSASIGWFTKLVEPPLYAASCAAKSEVSAVSSRGSNASGWTINALGKDQMGIYLCLFNDGTRMTVDPLTQSVQYQSLNDQVASYPIQKEKLPSDVKVKIGQFSVLLRKYFNYES